MGSRTDVSIAGTWPPEAVRVEIVTRPSWLPPLWIIPYLGSILAANLSGSATDTIAGANVEHVFLGGSLVLAVLLLLYEGNFRRIGGLREVSKYLALFGLALLLGLLSSIHPGPRIVGAATLVYWCGLVLSTGVAALAALTGHTRWVLAAVALSGLPLAASILQTFFPALAQVIPAVRLQEAHMGRATGLFANPNMTGFALYCSLAGCLCLYCASQRRWVRCLCLGGALLFGVATVFTVSRASILVVLLTATVFLYTLWRRARHRWAIIAVAVVLAGIALHRMSARFGQAELSLARVSDPTLYEADSFRLHALRRVALDMHRNLFLGEGTGQFVERSHIYLKGISFPGISIYDKSPHNQVLALWVEWGFLALILVYSAHAWIVSRGLAKGLRRLADGMLMLLVAYVCILLYLQLHGTNSPASCALLGVCAGAVFRQQYELGCMGVGGATA